MKKNIRLSNLKRKFGRNYFLNTLLFCFLLFSLVVPLGATTSSSAGTMWLRAYEIYEKAESDYGKKEYGTSLGLYRRAIELFGELSSKHPSWNKALIQYRVEHCEKRVSLLNDKLVKVNREKSPEELVKDNLALQSRVVNFQTLLTDEQRKLKLALASLEETQRESLRNKNASREFKKLFKEKIELEKRYSLLSSQVESLREEKDESESLHQSRKMVGKYRAELDKLQKENKEFQENNKKLETQYQELTLEKTRIELNIAKSSRSIQAYKDKLYNSESKVDRLNAVISSLKKEKEILSQNVNHVNSRLSEEQNNYTELNEKIKRGAPISNVFQTENLKLQKRLAGYQKKIDRLMRVKQALAGELVGIKDKYSRANNVLAKVQQRRVEIQNEAEVLRQKYDQKRKKELEYMQKINKLQTELDLEKKEYKLLADKYKELQKKEDLFQNTLNQNIALKNKKKQWMNIADKFQERIKELAEEKKENEQYKKRVLEANNKITSLQHGQRKQLSKIKNLMSKIKDMEGDAFKLNFHRENIKNELWNAQNKIAELKQEHIDQIKNMQKMLQKIGAGKISHHQLNEIKEFAAKLEIAEKKACKAEMNSSLAQEKFIVMNNKLALLEKTRSEQNRKLNSMLDDVKPAGIDKKDSETGKKLIVALMKIDELNKASLDQTIREKTLTEKLKKHKQIADKISSERLDLEEQLDAAKGRISKLEQERESNSEVVNDLVNKIQQAQKKFKDASFTNNKTTKKLVATKKKLSALQTKCSEQTETINKLMSTAKQKGETNLGSQLSYIQTTKTKKQLETANNEITKSRVIKDQQQLKIDTLANELEANKKKYSKSELLRKRYMLELATATKRISVLEGKCNIQQNQLKKIDSEIESTKKGTAESQLALYDSKKQLLMTKNAIAQLEAERNSLQEKLQNIATKFEEKNKNFANLDSQNSQLKKEFAKAKNSIAGLQEERSELQKKLNDLIPNKQKKLHFPLCRVDQINSGRNNALAMLLPEGVVPNIQNHQKVQVEDYTSNETSSANTEKLEGDELSNLKSKLNSLLSENKNLSHSVSNLRKQIIFKDAKPLKNQRNLSSESANEQGREVNRYLKRAEEALVKGNMKSALTYYEIVFDLCPENQQVVGKAGMLALELHDYAKAELYLDLVKNKGVDVLIGLGFCALHKNDFYKALSMFSQASTIEKNNPEILNYMGIACSELGWYDAAVKNFEKAIKISPKSSETAYNLAVLLVALQPKKNAEAKKWYKIALANGAKPNPKLEKLLN